MSEWTQDDFENMRKGWGNNTLVGWKLVYRKGVLRPEWGHEIRSTEMNFNEAPQHGVLGLIKYYERLGKGSGYSREVQNGLDLYVLFSMLAEELTLPPEVKMGINVPNPEFDAALREMRADDEIVIGMQDADLYTKKHII